jgi:hypothetical protein
VNSNVTLMRSRLTISSSLCIPASVTKAVCSVALYG